MTLFAWILSGLLALAFFGAGASKLLTARPKLLENPQMAWASDFSNRQVKTIGTLEVLGAVGVILPWRLGIAEVLTPLAATGLAAIMVGALLVHRRRGELKAALPVNSVLLALAVSVAAIRFAQL
ncbi:MAG TPA: DoxX family protein [Propionibacteriaceae bacterium]